MKIHRAILFISMISICVAICTCSKNLQIKLSKGYIDPTKYFDTQEMSSDENTIDSITRHILIHKDSNGIDNANQLQYLFRNRSLKLVKIFENLLHSNDDYIVTQSINALSQMDYPIKSSEIMPLLKERKAIFAEYLIYNQCRTSGSITFELNLRELSHQDSLLILSSINNCDRLYRNKLNRYNKKFHQLNSNEYVQAFSSTTYDNYNQMEFENEDSSSYQVTIKNIVYPHIQYKDNRLTKNPIVSFGHSDSNMVFHVGEDSGWEFNGLPVHSIADGVVRLIQYKVTWGYLVAIESIDQKYGSIVHYYGHLSSDINFEVGNSIRAGDIIGTIGHSLSHENGGYNSHLHLGIEKSSMKYSRIAGYSKNINRWLNPVVYLNVK